LFDTQTHADSEDWLLAVIEQVKLLWN